MAERKTVAARVDADLGAWLERYAAERGMKKSDVLLHALEDLRREDVSAFFDRPAPEPQRTPVKVRRSAVPSPRSVDEVLKPMSPDELRAWKRAQTNGGHRGVA